MYKTCRMGLKERENVVKLENIVAATPSEIACELAVAPKIKIIPCSYFNLSDLAAIMERIVCTI